MSHETSYTQYGESADMAEGSSPSAAHVFDSFKVVNGLTPASLSNLLTPYIPSRARRSFDEVLLVLPSGLVLNLSLIEVELLLLVLIYEIPSRFISDLFPA